MFANFSKFQAIPVGNKDRRIEVLEIGSKLSLKIDSNLTLLCVQIDENLKFDAHIEKICNKTARQLNSLKRLDTHEAR